MSSRNLDGGNHVNIDNFELEVDCPNCGFANPIWLRQARLRDAVICRGCKGNIQLDDGMNIVRKAAQSMGRLLRIWRNNI